VREQSKRMIFAVKAMVIRVGDATTQQANVTIGTMTSSSKP